MTDILIIGGGLAGLTAAIHLSKAGQSVVLIEKKSFPQHKVCGEYVSNEILNYLQNLDANPLEIGANPVQRFRLSSPSGKTVTTPLPLGGFGIRRFTFDHFLSQKAQQSGAKIIEQTTVSAVHFEDDYFTIECQKGQSFQAKVVIGSFGKRSLLDKQLQRPFFHQPSDYLGVKHFLKGDYPSDLVELFNFPGGYCGAIQVEDKTISLAYLTKAKNLKKYGSLEVMEAHLLLKNPLLKRLFEAGEPVLKRPQTISNISFLRKEVVNNHILMVGDAAGMIAPVCGNGMAMGIHGAKIAAELVIQFLSQQISRSEMEVQFEKKWRKQFGRRVFWGRQLQKFMGRSGLSEFAVSALKTLPFLFPKIIEGTHGTIVE